MQKKARMIKITSMLLTAAALAFVYQSKGEKAQQAMTEARKVAAEYQKSISQSAEMASEVAGEIPAISPTAIPAKIPVNLLNNLPTGPQPVPSKTTESKEIGKVCNANRCVYQIETVEKVQNSATKEWEIKKTLKTKTELRQLGGFEAEFKPRPECENPNLDWAKFVKCKNEKITAREVYNKAHPQK